MAPVSCSSSQIAESDRLGWRAACPWVSVQFFRRPSWDPPYPRPPSVHRGSVHSCKYFVPSRTGALSVLGGALQYLTEWDWRVRVCSDSVAVPEPAARTRTLAAGFPPYGGCVQLMRVVLVEARTSCPARSGMTFRPRLSPPYGDLRGSTTHSHVSGVSGAADALPALSMGSRPTCSPFRQTSQQEPSAQPSYPSRRWSTSLSMAELSWLSPLSPCDLLAIFPV
jgi:hypothetical protein